MCDPVVYIFRNFIPLNFIPILTINITFIFRCDVSNKLVLFPFIFLCELRLAIKNLSDQSHNSCNNYLIIYNYKLINHHDSPKEDERRVITSLLLAADNKCPTCTIQSTAIS